MGTIDGLICWNCGKQTGLTGRMMRSDNCSHCLADMRCCRGCKYFDPTRRFQCRETIENRVGNKEKANLCDFFQTRDAFKRPGGMSHQIDPKEERKKGFDDLFKD